MTIEPHIIRLRGPWSYEIAAEDNQDRSGIFDFGGDWRELTEPPMRGRLRLARRFGCPGHLDPEERVVLVVEGRGVLGSKLLLNDRDLTPPPSERTASWRLDITSLLQPRNELILRIDAAGAPTPWTRPIDDVRLEIES